MKRRNLILVTTALILSLLLTAGYGFKLKSSYALSGSDWRAGRIIDDHLFTNQTSMSVTQIQAFLDSKVPTCDTNHAAWNGNNPPFTCLKEYYENTDTKANNYGGQPIPAGAKSAAQIIWEAANQHNISPQVLLITLQKEQGLITDTWPILNQYKKAMGAHCPDTAPCDPAYASFSAQMLEGAELFRYYLNNMGQSWWPYAKPGNRAVLYNPNSSCGSSNVFIENAATAALYTYTPYQPNAAALANLNGTGDGCSAYGNRNFWRDYNNWFGPTTSNGYTLAIADNGDQRQWVIMNGRRHLVPNADIKRAWNLPDTPITWDDNYLGSFPDGSTLTRLMRPGGSLNIYLLADGKKYRLPNLQMLDIWNTSIGSLVDVSAGLGALPTDAGDLSYLAKLETDGAVYLMDSGIKRHILSTDVMKSFGGDTPYVSTFTNTNDPYFSGLSSGSAIGNPKITNGSQNFVVDSARKLLLDSVTNQLFPWTASVVTPAVYNYFGTQNMTPFVRAWDSPDVFVVDAGTKHRIIDPQILDAWQSATYSSSVTVTSRGFRDLMSTGVNISDYLASNGSSNFVIDKYKRLIPSSLASSYTTTRTVFGASTALLSIFPQGSEVSGFIRSAGSSTIYLLTQSGTRRNFVNTNRLVLWTEGHTITDLRSDNVNRFPSPGGINAFVSDGSTNYLLSGGQKHVVSNGVKTNWQLGTPDDLSDGTLSGFPTGSAITNELQYNGAFFLIQQGTAYGTTDGNVANMWSVDDAVVLNTALVSEYLRNEILARIARSKLPGDTRLFIANYGNLYRLYPNHAANLQANGPFTWIDPSGFAVYDWTAVAVKDEAGNHYVIDAGTKRFMPAGPIRSQWTNGGTASVPTTNNGFLNTLLTIGQIERAIKGSGPSIFLADNLHKRHIQSSATYSSSYAPFTGVNDSLLDSMPTGTPIP